MLCVVRWLCCVVACCVFVLCFGWIVFVCCVSCVVNCASCCVLRRVRCVLWVVLTHVLGDVCCGIALFVVCCQLCVVSCIVVSCVAS